MAHEAAELLCTSVVFEFQLLPVVEKNFPEVCRLVVSRPHLLFKDLKYSLPVSSEYAPPSKMQSSKFAKHFRLSENIHVARSECYKRSLGICYLHSYQQASTFIVFISSGQSIDSVVKIHHDEDKYRISANTYINSKDVNMAISEQLRTWLTSANFKYTPSANALVCPKNYYHIYQDMKGKYTGKVKLKWDMQTDPDKFIHEDLAIASYLICVWSFEYGEDAHKMVKFVDIGCGNGLLVYILNQEGFIGIGIDVQRRKIWQSAFNTSCYKQLLFDPKEIEVISQYNWLLGNHSDELTPWFPYVSTMLSYDTNFFVIPCCPWNFSTKYSRNTSQESTYKSYLSFISNIITDFKFKFKQDTLKIPSTKRVCFISFGRRYNESEYNEMLMEALAIVEKYSDDNFSKIVAREKQVKVRNGTKVRKDLCQKIVDITAALLINTIEHSNSTSEWHCGVPISLPEVVGKMKQKVDFCDDLKQQCGGVQTILRNHHQIFCIENGSVRFRDWRVPQRKKKKNKKFDQRNLYKVRICWFYENHPQGCPLFKTDCNYAHGINDLNEIV